MNNRFKVGDKVTYSPRGVIGTIGGYQSGYYRVEYATGWVDVRADVEELRLVEWTTLAELRPGAVFETEEGERGVKVKLEEPAGYVRFARLSDGAMRFQATTEAATTKVRELEVLS